MPVAETLSGASSSVSTAVFWEVSRLVAGLQRVGLHANGYRGGTLRRAAKQRDGVLVERARSDKVEAARAVQEAVFVGLGGRGVGPRRIVAARHGGGSGEKAGGEEGENMEFHCVSE